MLSYQRSLTFNLSPHQIPQLIDTADIRLQPLQHLTPGDGLVPLAAHEFADGRTEGRPGAAEVPFSAKIVGAIHVLGEAGYLLDEADKAGARLDADPLAIRRAAVLAVEVVRPRQSVSGEAVRCHYAARRHHLL